MIKGPRHPRTGTRTRTAPHTRRRRHLVSRLGLVFDLDIGRNISRILLQFFLESLGGYHYEIDRRPRLAAAPPETWFEKYAASDSSA